MLRHRCRNEKPLPTLLDDRREPLPLSVMLLKIF